MTRWTLGLPTERGRDFRQRLVVAVHKVLAHIGRILAEVRLFPETFAELAVVNHAAAATQPNHLRAKLVGKLSELCGFVAV